MIDKYLYKGMGAYYNLYNEMNGNKERVEPVSNVTNNSTVINFQSNGEGNIELILRSIILRERNKINSYKRKIQPLIEKDEKSVDDIKTIEFFKGKLKATIMLIEELEDITGCGI
ncbi:hypothetical protein [Clostridium tagluense]|uniref:hypothetical protein n=1 Tax=Clostridium tagluense TaxID=360422 RepID=UPI001CF33AE1|nr:hypothetical protein [Clostridium tagluense]MCB2297072.1 hypothetical protein [Clostridium tagluense]